jgi:hypothetical protein
LFPESPELCSSSFLPIAHSVCPSKKISSTPVVARFQDFYFLFPF